MNDENYVEDLLLRMESDVVLPKLPHEKIVSSATHSISFMAHAEARECARADLLPQLQFALRRIRPAKRYRKAVYILGFVAANSGDAQCRDLFLKQIGRKGLKNLDYSKILLTASSAGIPEVSEHIQSFLAVRNYDVLSEALNYCKTNKVVCAVEPICELLDQDCYHICDPLFAILALEAIGDPSAIPCLKRAFERHRHGRKGENIDASGYALAAIRTLEGSEQASDGKPDTAAS